MYVISHSFAPPNEGDKMCAHNAASAASASAAAASARRRDADIAPRAETCVRWAEEAVRDRVGPPVLEKEKQQKNATRYFGFVNAVKSYPSRKRASRRRAKTTRSFARRTTTPRV
jgi:hypothetical protein